MTVSLILDGVVAVLLVATIAYCVVLDRRLRALRGIKEELREVIASFNQATTRAEAGIARLKGTGEAVGEALQEQMEEARARYDELLFVMDRADKMVSVLGPWVSAARGGSAPGGAPEAGADEPQAKAESPPGMSRAERELREVLESAR